MLASLTSGAILLALFVFSLAFLFVAKTNKSKRLNGKSVSDENEKRRPMVAACAPSEPRWSGSGGGGANGNGNRVLAADYSRSRRDE